MQQQLRGLLPALGRCRRPAERSLRRRSSGCAAYCLLWCRLSAAAFLLQQRHCQPALQRTQQRCCHPRSQSASVHQSSWYGVWHASVAKLLLESWSSPALLKRVCQSNISRHMCVYRQRWAQDENLPKRILLAPFLRADSSLFVWYIIIIAGGHGELSYVSRNCSLTGFS